MITEKRTKDGQVYYVIGMDSDVFKEGQKQIRERLDKIEELLVKVLKAQQKISNLPSIQWVEEPWTEENLVARINQIVDWQVQVKHALAEVTNA